MAIGRHELVGKVIVSLVVHLNGDRPEDAEAVGQLTADMIAGTPLEQDDRAKSPHSDRLQDMLDKLGSFDPGF